MFPKLDRMLKQNWVKRIIKGVIPSDLYGKAKFWFVTEFNVKRTDTGLLSRDLRKNLTDYYKEDVALLRKLFEVAVPWPEFQNISKGIEVTTPERISSRDPLKEATDS